MVIKLSNFLADSIREDKEYAQLQEAIRKDFLNEKPLPILINGLCDGAVEAFLLSFFEDNPKKETALLLCPEEKDCVRFQELFTRYGIKAAVFAGRDFIFSNMIASHELEHERLHVLFGLLNKSYDVVLTTAESALGYIIPPERLLQNLIQFDADHSFDLSELTKTLIAAGYTRAEQVEGKGQFAVRGGILDIYPPNAHFIDSDGEHKDGSHPIRIDFFGDQIDRMGIFDPDTQRTLEVISFAEISPAREILISEEDRKKLKAAIVSQQKDCKDAGKSEKIKNELAVIDQNSTDGVDIPFVDRYISLIYPEKISLLDYFSNRTTVFMIKTNNIYESIHASEWHMNETIKELLSDGMIGSKYAEFSKTGVYLDAFLDHHVVLHVDTFSYKLSGSKMAGIFGFKSKKMISYNDNIPILMDDINNYVAQNYRIILAAENETDAKNFCGYLKDKEINASLGDVHTSWSDIRKGSVLVLSEEGVMGFELINAHTVILSTSINERKESTSARKKSKNGFVKKTSTQKILSYADLNVGNIVVHEDYGIGRYTGLETLTINGVKQDFFGIQYAGTDKLYLPVDQLDKLSKYIGAHADDGIVKLSKLGNDSWKKTKARTKAAVKDIAKDLIKLYAERARRPGFAFPTDDEYQRGFDASFEYEETDAQLKAIDDVKKDMISSTPMERLICGDVGFGKTEIALRAAYKAVLGGKQVAVLVPTTILALQHYQTFTSRMRAFGVNVDMISRFRSKKEQDLTLRKLKRGEVDILIGTHRLIGKGIEFHDLGLLVVDEEQRFGVAQKEKLKQMAGNVDVLTLTATPIPRTLNMALGGLRDISVLDEAPVDRQPVQTYVLEEDELIIEEAIKKELRRGGQIFYLHNVVETIDDVAAALSRRHPNAKIMVAHGKMDRDTLEEIWEKMLAGEIDILVCTTIIETGVDIPNANTLIVDNAHRLGLSQLHQLRGRVGRSSRRAYAYFTYPAFHSITEIAQKRLEAIRDYAEFGAGFKIAMRDMEIRGAGNLLGTQQHGHMDAVGYDLYIKLLNQAVIEERGESVTEEHECTISVNVDAYIPEKYVKYPAQRMEMYKKIALIGNEQDREDIYDEFLDRFGEPPQAVNNLLDVAVIRADGKKCGVSSINQNGHDLVFRFVNDETDHAVWKEMANQNNLFLSFSDKPKPIVHVDIQNNTFLILVHRIFEKYTEMLHAKK